MYSEAMFIIPALYLSNGQCVSHYKGEPSHTTILSKNPLHAARSFEKQGAQTVHIVDLDATKEGSEKNRRVALQIAQNTALSVQYADGLDSLETMESLFSRGIDIISLDHTSEFLLPEALVRFGSEKIFFTIETKRELVSGKSPDLAVMDYGKELAEKGVTTIIFRDTKAEGTLHPNFDEIERLVMATEGKIFAFGGIGTVEDIALLEKTGAAGVILSRALFERKLSLETAIKQFSS